MGLFHWSLPESLTPSIQGQALVRDSNCCVLSGKYDTAKYVEQVKRGHTPNTSYAARTEAAHIIPEPTNTNTSEAHQDGDEV